MTTSIPTNNPVPAQAAGLPGVQAPGGATGVPGDAQWRGVPAAASGVTGGAPTDLAGAPSGASAEAAYYFLEAAQPSSPQVLPLLNVAPPGAEPPLGFTVPATAGGADPRGLPGRSALPGQHLGSTAPATPAVELGAQPFVPAVPPASSFAPPNESSVRPAPAVAAGTTRISPPVPAQIPNEPGPAYSFEPDARSSTTSSGPLYFLSEMHHPKRLGTTELLGSGGIRPDLIAKPE